MRILHARMKKNSEKVSESILNMPRTRKEKLSPTLTLPEVIEAVLALNKKTTDHDTSIQTLEGRVDSVETRITTVENNGLETARLLGLLTSKVDDLVKSVDSLHDKVNKNSDSIAKLSLTVTNHVEKHIKYEAEDKSKTLIIEGLSEGRGKEDLRGFIDDLFADLGLSYGNERCDSIFRLGKVPEDRPGFKRPIVVKLTNKAMKGEIYRNVRKLQGNPTWTGISLMDQLSDTERREYNDLRCIFFLAKRVGIKGVKLRQRSVIIGGKTYAHSDLDMLPYGLSMRKATTIKTPDGIGFKSSHNPFSNLFPCFSR